MKTKRVAHVQAVLTLAAAAVMAAPLIAQDRPFSKEELIQYMRANLPASTDRTYDAESRKIARLIRERGVNGCKPSSSGFMKKPMHHQISAGSVFM